MKKQLFIKKLAMMIRYHPPPHLSITSKIPTFIYIKLLESEFIYECKSNFDVLITPSR